MTEPVPSGAEPVQSGANPVQSGANPVQSGASPVPSGANPVPSAADRFKTVNATQEAEDAYDLAGHRSVEKPTGVLGSTMHLVKGALGGGILSGHVAYLKAGLFFGLPINIFLGIYMTYCLHLLVWSAQVVYKRTGIPRMTYPDLGQAACTLFPNTKVQKCGKFFRHYIDLCIMIDLFGSCACYQLIMATTIKQLVEDVQKADFDGFKPGYPNLRIYMLVVIVPCILIVMIRHLKYLAPLSLIANLIILLVIVMTVYYFTQFNPNFQNIRKFNDIPSSFECIGMIVFSMSCAGVVIPIENNMKNPYDFPKALMMGMTMIVLATSCTSTFGYVAFLSNSKAPITVNFPMTLFWEMKQKVYVQPTLMMCVISSLFLFSVALLLKVRLGAYRFYKGFPKIVKGCMAGMIYVTHAVNFWAPFELAFHYLKPRHKPENIVRWEYFYRAIICILISIVAIIFPAIDHLMGFFGCFCLTNMAFIWPILINLMVIWERPGLGKRNWRLWRGVFLITIGFIIWVCGTIVSVKELLLATFW